MFFERFEFNGKGKIMEDKLMRNITVEMACSINGLIATEDGNEDFLSYRGWEIMLEFLKEYDVLIWRRKTWDNIIAWGRGIFKRFKKHKYNYLELYKKP